MNKAELVTALAERLDGDRKSAAEALDGLVDVIVRAVQAGETVTVTGFGVFERRERAARAGRNPRTGEVIQLPAAAIPGFRAGAMFRDVVSGARELGEPAPSRPRTRPAAAPAAAAPAPRTPVEDAPAATDGKAAKAPKSGKATKPAKPAAKDAKPAKDGKAAKGAKAKDAKGKDAGKKKAKK
ncbi:hypothetical protein GCM10023321_40160 [Pseudonocardia eucalypti]|uniref:DNA-binding protein HU-beta n=1 Tax=Pseudonocardia eucalypti TaxID=648755 RepID=A0ABP9QBH0_9PSEU|nr:DNA-binding protein HU-beta [Pseudonocardia eucalypti]